MTTKSGAPGQVRLTRAQKSRVNKYVALWHPSHTFARAMGLILMCVGTAIGCAKERHAMTTPPLPDSRYELGELLYANDFTAGTGDFAVELEQGGDVRGENGALTINVPAGCSVWLKRPFEGPLMIEYDVTFLATESDDRLSDLNLFWMATDARSADFFAVPRSGRFADYNQLKCYYAGIGGNANTTTRFRRYIGDIELRPLLPEHDLSDPKFLLEAGRTYHIRAVACGNLIQLFRDGQKLFELIDDESYTAGHFAFRTVASHQRISGLTVRRVLPR